MCKPPVIGSYSTPFKAGVGRHFDPRSPRGERPWSSSCCLRREGISIHAPREGSDVSALVQTFAGWVFLSTLPARGATDRRRQAGGRLGISIHAPREGSDADAAQRPRRHKHFYPRSPRGERRWRMWAACSTPSYFYPRSPRGERPWPRCWAGHLTGFLSTLPARGATPPCGPTPRPGRFLSTLPARGATRGGRLGHCIQQDFYPRSPRGERRGCGVGCAAARGFLSTLPARGATQPPTAPGISVEFLSTLPARGATGPV